MSWYDWFEKEILNEFKIALQPILEKKKILVFLLFLTIAAFILGQVNKTLLFISVLTIVASFSMIYNLFIRISLGFELIMLATVLCSIVYGPVVGMAVGLTSLLFAEIISTKLSYNTFISFIGIIIIGFIASFFLIDNITIWGILMTIIYDLIIIPGYLLTGSNPFNSFIYVATHIPWNIWIFAKIAPMLLKAMT